jgi:N-acetylglutamate synthase-like GNAT family acetyltransferase|tara:strand:+ start:3713 stop:4150 length:438 start_codon:yes stop_codon:yes gene_type:complete
MEIRKAEKSDIKELYNILVCMHSETELPVDSICEKKLFMTIYSVIEKGIVYIAIEKNKIVGSIGGMFNSEWWSLDKFLCDLWFYVIPKHRKSTAAIKLVKSFINDAKKVKVKTKLGHVYSGDIERKDKFFERLGLVKAGSFYMEV